MDEDDDGVALSSFLSLKQERIANSKEVVVSFDKDWHRNLHLLRLEQRHSVLEDKSRVDDKRPSREVPTDLCS